jgi:DNA topoisomerase I
VTLSAALQSSEASDDGAASAAAAGLRYVHDGQPGLQRVATGRHLRVGKRWVAEFFYRDKSGRRMRDRATLDRIRGLAIPPAWRAVWICSDPRGHLQATGRDARGRKQYRYHPRWREERDGTKYGRMIDFGRALPALRRQVAADLRRPGLPRAKVLAAIVRLLETTFMRIGNDEYARTNHSFGLTTLEDRHVDVRQGRLRFHFRGKSGVFHDVDVRDPQLARVVRRCRDLPGQELFQYVDGDGVQRTVDSADVNAYIRTHTGHGFTAKDFRTWAGTVLAAEALAAICAEGTPRPTGKRGGARPWKPTNKHVVQVIAEVASRLGNTVSVCRKSYVHPGVISAFLEGAFLEGTVKTESRRAQTARRPGLRREEAAVLQLLCRPSGTPLRRAA